MQANIVVLAGDGIGPEVTNEGKKILDAVGELLRSSTEAA